MKRIKNTTANPILHTNSGISFLAGVYQDASDPKLQDDQSFNLLSAGSFLFNDGSVDFASPTLAWDALRGIYPRQIQVSDLAGNNAGVSTNSELRNNDSVYTSALDTVVNLTTSPVELKVGGSRLANRKYIWIEALSSNVKWGFSNSTQSFDLFKNQLVCFPVGVAVWAKVSTATGSVAVGEGA